VCVCICVFVCMYVYIFFSQCTVLQKKVFFYLFIYLGSKLCLDIKRSLSLNSLNQKAVYYEIYTVLSDNKVVCMKQINSKGNYT